MDFFAGSGPTLAVAKKLNLKFIGVEMGEHFETFYSDEITYKNSPSNKVAVYKDFDVTDVTFADKKLTAKVNKVGLLGRLKEVCACCGRHEPCGISKTVNWQGGGFFKYYTLEQYEDTLNRCAYSADGGEPYDENNVFGQYVFFADNKLSYVLNTGDGVINLDFSKLYDDIDFPETISMLYGKAIEKITPDAVKLADIQEPIKYNVENMTDEEKLDFIRMLKPLIWWGE